jgi:hypothetical protein
MLLLTIAAMLSAGADAATKDPNRAAAEAAAAQAAAAAEEAESAADAAQEAARAAHTDGQVYDPTRDADADVAAAFTRARANGRMVMVVLGGNWCHDSRALAGHFAEADFQTMLSTRYEVVYVDVGHRDRNLQIPARYGMPALQGTPTVLILSADGTLLNRGTAGSWRNAASRRRDTILSAFRNFGGRTAS